METNVTRETWLIRQWILDPGPLREYVEGKPTGAELREMVLEQMPELESGLYLDLLTHAIESADWDRLAATFADD